MLRCPGRIALHSGVHFSERSLSHEIRMLLKRDPPPSLRPFVKSLWVADQTNEQRPSESDREYVLPTGHMHLVFRLSDHALRLFDDAQDSTGHILGRAIVGGTRSTYYTRDISKPSCSIGAMLLPGAAEHLFGVPADELAERHTLLDDLWGQAANSAHEQLIETSSPEQKMDLLESLLAARLPAVRGLHPAVASALEQFWTTTDVRKVVMTSGYSHRRFIALFRRAVGLTPKLYCRVLRFQRALEHVAAHPSASWVDLALDAGYSDQPHFTREFREFAGLTPEQYRKASPSFAHHVPVIRPPR
jgi:AraC-like DNA-binding protein